MLDPKHPLTKLIIQDFDETLLHPGPEGVLAELRHRFWILWVRKAIKGRGKPFELLSDNGTNFVGGARELHEAFEAMVPRLKEQLAEQQIKFCFMEAILNAKPLGYIYSDVADPDPITPSVLLMGRHDASPPQVVYDSSDILGNRQWRHSQVLVDHFWPRFMSHYLAKGFGGVKLPRPRCDIIISVLVFGSTSHALLDRFLQENTADDLFPRYLDSDDDGQYTSCDFESFCHWTLSNYSGQSDWWVTSPQQPRKNTPAGVMLPFTDHSVGSSNGHFLFLSPSPTAETPGKCEYHLVSPVLAGSGGMCLLQLAFYEAGPLVGNVTLLVKPAHSRSATTSKVLNHRRRDGSRAEWEVLETVIGRVDEPFQVTLLYNGCLGKDGAILALDSIELRDCKQEQHDLEFEEDCETSFQCDTTGCIAQSQVCDFHPDCPLGEDEGFICDALPFGSYCSFEQDQCGWSVSKQHSAWRRVAGEDLMEREDMRGIALQSTPGYFLFLRVRGSNSPQEASIQSASFPPPVSTSICQLHFSLYLFGEYNGTILVAIEENRTAASPLVWKRNGQWTDDWQDITLQLTGLHHGFHVKVTALWGEGSSADIALDDIAVGAACFNTDVNSLLLSHRFFHDMGSMEELDDLFSPLPEPSASEVSLMTWWFTSCGASGPRGPTQAQCDSAYRNTNVSVTVWKDGPLKGVQMWRVPATNRYMISAYGAAGGKGAKNHNKRSHGVFISAIFPLEKGDLLYILVGHQGEDACPGRNPLTQKICLGESSVIEDDRGGEGSAEWAGGGGGGGGATYIFKMDGAELVPLLIAAGGGGKAYLEDPESSLDQMPLEQYENDTGAPSNNGRTGAAGGGGGWKDSPSPYQRAGKSLLEGADGGSSCLLALSKLSWATFGGFGGGGGACTAGGGGGGYRGGDAALTDDITADGQDGISFVHPMGEIFLQPLAAMESHGECEIKVQLNCSHCQTQSCTRDEETHIILCLCHNEDVLASDNVTCTAAPQLAALEGQLSLSLILAVVASTIVIGIILTCASLTLIYYRKKNQLHAVRVRLQSPEYKLSKIRSSTIMTDYNPNYCFAGKAVSLSDLKEVPRKNITLLRALGHGAFGEVYEGQILGMCGDNTAMQVAIKTLPEICSEQDEMDFLMEALIMSKFSHQNIVRCIGVSLHILPRFILLELMTGGDMKTFLRQNRPRAGQTSSLTMLELLHMARDIAFGCRYLEENHFIHRDIAARNCLLTCPGPDRVAKIGDFGMARDIYRASYYRKGGRAMLPVKWMPPEAFMEGIFTCKTDTWSFGVLLWEILSLGYMPYPCKTNQEVLEFVTSGGRMDPPKGCPGPVYRIMTQCWQHCPEHRPNFSTILERINYCTQDPDVINTPLPMEYSPTMEEEGGTVIRPSDHTSSSLTPLLVSHSCSQDLSSQLAPSSVSLSPSLLSPQPTKPRLLLQRNQHIHQEVTSYHEALEPSWAETVPASSLPLSAAGVCTTSSWLHPETLHHQPCSRNSSSSGSQRLKNKTKNLWNPTYGSWVLENFSRGKKTLAHTQSMPLSSSASSISTTINAQVSQSSSPTSECTESGCDGANSTQLSTSSLCSPSSVLASTQPASNMSNRKNPTGTAATGGPTAPVDLAKLQSFPCGNVNYAYDEPNYEAESLPLVMPKTPEASTNTSSASSFSSGSGLGLAMGLGLHTSSSCMPKLMLKRHASYGHEDVRRHTKAEKPTRDRDSGFSLSEDLSVTPV
ncbi:tyrosine-protein kinase receptor [Lampris incognitus]|uniref:tyrosine-protein kinase receptor n=1 Tax=Lampris incognitus TaxID=2546036 RepID=UPI0024B4DD11|nr:tyrosine-protein kinase receptor [Lampris incognitus]